MRVRHSVPHKLIPLVADAVLLEVVCVNHHVQPVLRWSGLSPF
jgi:hypothetical protein